MVLIKHISGRRMMHSVLPIAVINLPDRSHPFTAMEGGVA
jgi:hypothetical protein